MNILPDKTARSFTLNPKAPKVDFKTLMLAKGGGRPFKASEESDTTPSLLPKGTAQYGPLICT